MNYSLRRRLLVGIAATTLIGLTATAAVNYLAIRRTLIREFDELLAAKARALVTLVEQQGNEIVVDFADRPMQEFARKIRPEYFEIWDEDGTVLARSRRLESGDLKRTNGSLAAPRFDFTTLPDGRPGRLVGVQFLPAVKGERLERTSRDQGEDPEDARDQVDFSGRRRVTLVVAKDTAEIDRSLGRMAWMLFGVSAAAVAVMLAALGWIVKRSLLPLDDLAAQIAELDERGLSASVHVSNSPQELAPVIARLNDLLARLAAAFQRERVFTANVAHELRTPLAGLRAMLDVVLGRSRGAAEYRRVLEDCQSICEDTHELVDTLLSLARIDAGRAAVDRSFLDIADAIAKSWFPFAARARERGLQVHIDGSPGALLYTDPAMFRIVLANLFDNAVGYCEYGGTLECRWTTDVRGLTLEIMNNGCNLSEEQSQRVFDRFWRADAARTATGLHAGLGLSLCSEIIETLSGSIDAMVRDGNFIVTIHFDAEFVESTATPGCPDDSHQKELLDRNAMSNDVTCPAVGMTLIELLTAIAIIGVLLVLLLPAVQQAREASRRASCLNNVKQVGLTLQGYEACHGAFPPSKVAAKGPKSGMCDEFELEVDDNPGKCTAHQSWTASCLPYLEESSLAAQYHDESPWSELRNRPAIGADVAIFRCPSAPSQNRVDRHYVRGAVAIDYAAISQVEVEVYTDVFGVLDPGIDARRGVLAEYVLNPTRKTIDGLSQTILIAESAGLPVVYVLGRPFGAEHVAVYTGDEILTVDGDYVTDDGIGWADPEVAVSVKGASDDGLEPFGARMINAHNLGESYSFHPGGALFLFADGSARLLSEDVDPWVYVCFCTRAGGEVVDEVGD